MKRKIICGCRLFACLVAAFAGVFFLSEAGAEEKAVPAAPTGTVTLSDAVALALERNPELAAFSSDIRAAEARQVQAGLRPNPELAVEVEELRLGNASGAQTDGVAYSLAPDGLAVESHRGRESSSGNLFSEAEFTVSLSQLVELGGKRAQRIRFAARDRDVAAWDYEVARADVLASTAQAFVTVLAAQERTALQGELVSLAEQVLNTVSTRVRAGRVSPLEAATAETALANAHIEADAAKQNLLATRVALAALWGDTEARFERAEGVLDAVQGVPSLDELRARVSRNPDLARWKAELDLRQSAIDVEKSKAKSDVTVTAGLRTRHLSDSHARDAAVGTGGVSVSHDDTRSDGEWGHSVALGVSVALPLFNRNQGAIREAEHMAEKSAQLRRAAEVQAHARLARAYHELSTAHATLRSLKDKIIPAASETFAAVNNAYQQGKFSYLEVLDAQRTLFEARRNYLDALAAYHGSVAEIERAIGESLLGSASPGAGKAN